MDFLDILGSVNKISILFFIITLGVLAYEFYLFRKEKRKQQKPKIPTFSQTKTVAPQNLEMKAPVVVEKKHSLKKHKNLTVVIASITIAFIGAVSFIAIRNFTSEPTPVPPVGTRAAVSPSPIISLTTTPGALFITPTPEEALAQNQLTPEASPSASPGNGNTATQSAGVGGGVTIAPTAKPTSSATTLLTTATPTVGSSATATPTPGASTTVTTTPGVTSSTLPVAGVAQPQFFIFALGAVTVLISVLF